MVIEGIDVSAYQGQVSWEDVKASGHRFAAMKATEGLGFEDPTFPRNWEHSKARGLVRVAYHFLRPGESGAAQADYLHAYVRRNGRFESGDGIMLDLEATDGQSRETVINCAVAFVSRILDQTIAGVFVYTYPDFWLNQIGNPHVPILAKCPLWLADYGPSVPHIPNWPGGLSIWQFSQTGWVPGVNGQVDLDRYYGNIATLHQLCRFGAAANMPAFRFTAPVVAGAALFGAYVALQLLQALLTHLNGKPDSSLVQVLAAFTPLMIGVVGVLGATAMSKSANADHRSQRTEAAVTKALNGAAAVPLKDGENHGDTPQVSPGP